MSEPCVVLCDLDGVVWLANSPLPRSAEAVNLLRSAGHRVVFVTNNSNATVSDQEAHLHSVGIPAEGDVVTSAMAAASLVEQGMAVLVCGGEGLVEAVSARGAEPFRIGRDGSRCDSVDAVLVGFHRSFDYESLRVASSAIRSGAKFIASNEDPTYPTADGPIPGGGSIVAAIASASGAVPIVAGKPHSPMAQFVRSKFAGIDATAVMVGDRMSTDGRFAEELRCRFALVRSEVSEETSEAEARSRGIRIDFEGASLWEVSRDLLAHG